MADADRPTAPVADTPSTTAPTSASAAATRVGRASGLALLLAIVAAAFNLRPAVTSLGPLLENVRHSLGMSATVAGLLTSVPSLCFAVFGPLSPALARKLGPAATVLLGMAAIAVGLTARSLAPNTAVFLLLSAVALAGIAVSNVLMPVLVKRYFPDRIGPATGIYSMALSAGTAVAAATAVPLTGALGGGWRPGLAVWAIPAVAAVLCWLPRLRGASAGAPANPVGAVSSAAAPAARGSLVRSRTAWYLAVFFGLQATAAYATMGWLPQIFRDAGVSPAFSGVLLAITMAVSAPLSFVLPALAARRPKQGPFVVVLSAAGIAAYTGLALAPAAAPVLWALLAGLANASFPLALTMIGLRARSQSGVARLSAFAQSAGYLLSIPGPLLIGAFYQHTGGWTLPLLFLGALLIPQTISGWLAGRPRHVEDEAAVAD